ncbi:SIR2-like domain-containing protein [Hypoxylon trugodes]|uniref:SIR2-like domain-containing protein n=1 Tax=Hypoxylon trugodes TaxID=326681 RepID=UPI00219A5F7D|nr:SIR2-like domain-containing protein [Hypoxylon trugodes]KAI1389368.1 SIR2-like domain-containing protein [Hypoxylon trugodes]
MPPKGKVDRREENELRRERRRTQKENITRIRIALSKGKLAICVGSGVTLYSVRAGERRRMGWAGLIKNALQWLENQAGPIANQYRADMDYAREILARQQIGDQDLFEAINRLQKVMSKRNDLFSSWLRHQFETLYTLITRPQILDSLRELHRKGAMLFTTNYDDLLEKHIGIPSLTRTDENGVLAYERKSLDAVFHIHGHWQDPGTVVLSAEHYYTVKTHAGVQETLSHLLATKTVLFVGCGGGLGDPNVGPLLRWIGNRHAQRGAGHYILLAKHQRNPVPDLSLNHCVCANYDAIAPWLMGLLPDDDQREGLVHELPSNSRRLNVFNWLSPYDQTGFLDANLNRQSGAPIPFHHLVTHREDFWEADGRNFSFMWAIAERDEGKTMFCSSVIDATRQACRLATTRRSRDSLAYFFCATYDLNNPGERAQYDFSEFCRTVLNQLCPPNRVYPALRELCAQCTQYHPARQPTNAELQQALIGVISELDREFRGSQGDVISPGETYLILDGIDGLPADRQPDYLIFLRELNNHQFQHFHILISSNSLPWLNLWLSGGTPQQPWVRTYINWDQHMVPIRAEFITRFLDKMVMRGLHDPLQRDFIYDSLRFTPLSFHDVYLVLQGLWNLPAFTVPAIQAQIFGP